MLAQNKKELVALMIEEAMVSVVEDNECLHSFDIYLRQLSSTFHALATGEIGEEEFATECEDLRRVWSCCEHK